MDKINLIFDCDGTLIDSYGAITDHICRAFLKCGVVCDPENVRRRSLFSNLGTCMDETAAEYGIDPALPAAAYEELQENRSLITLYPHCTELLENERFRCFVYTHRGVSCHEIFSRLGIEECFEEIVDATYGFKRKPDGEGVNYIVEKYGLDKARTYYVGDRIMDIECGVNAGVGTVFVRSSGLDIDTSKADFVVSDLGEINRIFG